MPHTTAEAAAELRKLLKDRKLTARIVATHLGKSEAWMSRRLSIVVLMKIDDYGLIKESIEQMGQSAKSDDQNK